jgi:predicted metal-dependent hydrolase
MIFGEIDIKINRSKRKTVSIFVERDGTVSARVPVDLNEEDLNEVIQSKEYLIHKNLAEWKLLNSNKIDREFVNGQSFLYLGRNYRFRLVEEEFKGVKLRNGYFELSKASHAKAKEFFIDFYKFKLQEKLTPIIQSYQNKLGVKPKEMKVMELQHRWASCTNKSNLNFHWKCAMAPIDVLHYIVAHELVHLIHDNHTSAFWNELDKIVPQYEKQVHWLKMNGAGMDL